MFSWDFVDLLLRITVIRISLGNPSSRMSYFALLMLLFVLFHDENNSATPWPGILLTSCSVFLSLSCKLTLFSRLFHVNIKRFLKRKHMKYGVLIEPLSSRRSFTSFSVNETKVSRFSLCSVLQFGKKVFPNCKREIIQENNCWNRRVSLHLVDSSRYLKLMS